MTAAYFVLIVVLIAFLFTRKTNNQKWTMLWIFRYVAAPEEERYEEELHRVEEEKRIEERAANRKKRFDELKQALPIEREYLFLHFTAHEKYHISREEILELIRAYADQKAFLSPIHHALFVELKKYDKIDAMEADKVFVKYAPYLTDDQYAVFMDYLMVITERKETKIPQTI